MTNEGTHVPGEKEGGSLNPRLEQEDVEQKARDKGWKPQDEHTDTSKRWLSAEEFLDREPLYENIRELRKEITKQSQNFQKEVTQINAHFASQKKAAIEQAIRELKQQQRTAIRDEDDVRAGHLDDQIATQTEQLAAVKAVIQAVPKQVVGESDVLIQWKKENKWFEDDPELREEAIAIGTGRAALGKGETQEQILKYTENRIRRLYPDKFAKKETQVDEKVSKVESGTFTKQSTSTKHGKTQMLTEHDLTDAQRNIMKTLLKRHVLDDAAKKNNRTPKEEYLAQVSAIMTVE